MKRIIFLCCLSAFLFLFSALSPLPIFADDNIDATLSFEWDGWHNPANDGKEITVRYHLYVSYNNGKSFVQEDKMMEEVLTVGQNKQVIYSVPKEYEGEAFSGIYAQFFFMGDTFSRRFKHTGGYSDVAKKYSAVMSENMNSDVTVELDIPADVQKPHMLAFPQLILDPRILITT